MMYSYGPPLMAEQKQDDQLKHTYSSYVKIWDVVQKTCRRQWTIGKSGERGSGISVRAAQYDYDDDDLVRNKYKQNESFYLMPYNSWADIIRLLAEQYDTKSNIKLGGFRSQLQASYMSSHIEELWYKETICLWITIYIYIYRFRRCNVCCNLCTGWSICRCEG